jgi:hypothetical protein
MIFNSGTGTMRAYAEFFADHLACGGAPETNLSFPDSTGRAEGAALIVTVRCRCGKTGTFVAHSSEAIPLKIGRPQ